MYPYILHIETSTKTCSVAVSKGADCIALAENFEGDHTVVLNALIRDVLAQSDLKLKAMDAIAVNEGPGSYTALRIGVVTAKGISYALDKSLIMVPGLKVIARAAKDIRPGFQYYASLIDARRDEVYMAVYDHQLAQHAPPQSVKLNEELSPSLGITNHKVVIAGTGAEKWKQFITNWMPEIVILDPSARHMIPVALDMFMASEFTKTAIAKPFYLKLPNITTPKEKLITR